MPLSEYFHMNTKRFIFILSCLVYCLAGILTIKAQNSDTPKPLSNTHYIKNCFLVKQPGVILSGQNIIVKDGFISDIGPNLKIPYDAQILLADSMYVYAGFIDAYSNTGITKPEQKDRPRIADPGNPPNDIAGITPQFLSNENYNPNDKSVTDMRTAGFGLSQVAPRGMMLPGQSSIFLLGEGNTDEMILKSESAQNFQFETSRGVYPSTLIGIMAKFRDLYQNAKIAGQHEEKFLKKPSGLARPDYNKELKSLYPVTTKKQPLYIVAQKTKDVHKALLLKEEFGFDLVLTEVKQGWHYIDKIKQQNIPVLISLDLPGEEKKPQEKEAKDGEKKDSLKTEVKEIKKEKLDPEKKDFDAKKAAIVKEYLAQAANFEKYGINFGFSFLNSKPSDIKKTIKKLIDNGLSENGALAALTTNPTKILGLSHLLGTVEKGKIANLTITDKSYFDEKSVIKFVFVDGKKYDYSEKPRKQKDGKTDHKMIGLWSYEVEIPGAIQKGKINIKKDGSDFKISVKDDTSSNEDVATDINVDGTKLTFSIMASLSTPVKVDFSLDFEDKIYTGNVNLASFGSFPIKGSYDGDPKLNF